MAHDPQRNDRALIETIVARLERRVAFTLSIAERELYVSIGADTLTGLVVRLHLNHLRR